MTKHKGIVIVSIVLFTVLLSGCKMPASKGPEDTTDPVMTTPIVIQTDSPVLATQTEVAKFISTSTQSSGEGIPFEPTSTPEPTEVIVIPTITAPEEWTVQSGENITCLARRFDVNPEDIKSLNNVGDYIFPGDVLKIPQDSQWPTDSRMLNTHPDTYTVDPGDTIYSIACYYGDVSPEAIIAVNNLEEPYELTPGQELSIP